MRQVLTVFSFMGLLSTVSTAELYAQQARGRDSAGVRIIENSALKDAPVRFRLGDKPLMVVGGIESNPEQEFNHRGGWLTGIRLSNGGLVVIDGSRVHYFDVTGKRIRIVGRKGQGPEEFGNLTSICRTRGDTLIVSDSENRRLSVLDSGGRILRTILHGDNGDAVGSFCLDDGSFLLQRRMGDARDRQTRVTRMRTDGALPNVIGTFDMTGFDVVTQTPLRILASGDALYHGNPYSSEIRVHNALGMLQRIVRTADRRDRITDAQAEARLDTAFPRGTAAGSSENPLRSAPRIAQTWPVFYTFHVDPDRTIWVQDFDARTFAPPDSWTAVDSTGRIVGRLVLPPRQGGRRPEVQGFGRDYVIVRRFDEDMAQSIAVFPLVKIDSRSR